MNRDDQPRPLPPDAVPDFLSAIFGDAWERAYVAAFEQAPDTFDTSNEAGRKAQAIAWSGGEYARGGKQLIHPNRNCYACISTFDPERGSGRARRRKELFDKTHAVMLDDVGQKVDAAIVPIPPTFIVSTSPQSSQYWYVLKQPCADRERVEALYDALAGKGLTAPMTDPGATGVTRFGRLPMGVNNKTKYEKPWSVGLIGDYSSGPRYTMAELAEAFGVNLDVATQGERPSTRTLVPADAEALERATVAGLEAEGFAPRGPIGDFRRYELRACPWADGHTTGQADAHYFGPTDNNAYNGGFKCFHAGCADKGIRDLGALLRECGHDIPEPLRKLRLEDLIFVAPQNAYLCRPSGEFWNEAAVDKTLPSPEVKAKDGKTRRIKPSRWIAQHAAATQVSWLPGYEKIIDNAVLDENGFLDRRGGMRIVNLYTAPRVLDGDPAKAERWIGLCQRLYGQESRHLIAWCAHRVQRPGEKINHAPLICGGPGIGKDTLIEPVVWAVGAGNVKEIGPAELWSDFTDYAQAVILRVSEAHDLGDHSSPAFYERTKRIIAAPPYIIDVNSKYMKKFRIKNVVGVIYTSNHEGGGLFIPSDDRRHYVLWTNVTVSAFEPDYFRNLWLWYRDEGFRHIAAYLRAYDLSDFDPKAPPPKTESFMRVAMANEHAGHSAFRMVLEEIARTLPAERKTEAGQPLVITFEWLIEVGEQKSLLNEDFLSQVRGRGRAIQSIMRGLGYQALLRQPLAQSNEPKKRPEQRWSIGGRLRTVYGVIGEPVNRLVAAAEQLSREKPFGGSF